MISIGVTGSDGVECVEKLLKTVQLFRGVRLAALNWVRIQLIACQANLEIDATDCARERV